MQSKTKPKRKNKNFDHPIMSIPDNTQVSKLVDWIEIQAWSGLDQRVSKAEIVASFNYEYDNNIANEMVEKVWQEAKTRINYLTEKYPFVLSSNEELFIYRGDRYINIAYIFCLLVSYIGLPEGEINRIWKSGETARLFEKICAFVSNEYTLDMHNTSNVMIEFGSPRKEWISKKHIKYALPKLVKIIGDGEVIIDGTRSFSRLRGDGGDAGLDILVLKKFNDERQGSLVFLGQCAAAQERKEYMLKVNEMSDFLVDSVRFEFPIISAFFLPHVLSQADEDHVYDWRKIKTRRIIPFDRLRIAYYAKDWIHKDIDKFLDICKKRIQKEPSLF